MALTVARRGRGGPAGDAVTARSAIYFHFATNLWASLSVTQAPTLHVRRDLAEL